MSIGGECYHGICTEGHIGYGETMDKSQRDIKY